MGMPWLRLMLLAAVVVLALRFARRIVTGGDPPEIGSFRSFGAGS